MPDVAFLAFAQKVTSPPAVVMVFEAAKEIAPSDFNVKDFPAPVLVILSLTVISVASRVKFPLAK